MFSKGLDVLAQLSNKSFQGSAGGEIPRPVSMQHISVWEEVVVLFRVYITLFLYSANILTRCRVFNRHAVLYAPTVDIIQQLVYILEPYIAIDKVKILA